MNEGLVESAKGNLEGAGERFEVASQKFEECGRNGAARSTTLEWADMALGAAEEDWERFDRVFEAFSSGWPDEKRLTKNHPWLLELAADWCDRGGQRERASRAREIAGELWGDVGDERRRSRLESEEMG